MRINVSFGGVTEEFLFCDCKYCQNSIKKKTSRLAISRSGIVYAVYPYRALSRAPKISLVDDSKRYFFVKRLELEKEFVVAADWKKADGPEDFMRLYNIRKD